LLRFSNELAHTYVQHAVRAEGQAFVHESVCAHLRKIANKQ
jgi:hypothetical protein